jgi:transcription initiation factor TFIID subunit 5
MSDELAPLSDLSEQSSDEISADSPSKTSGDKGLDQGTRILLNTRGYKDGAQTSDKDQKDNRTDDGPRRATRSSARLQASQTQKEDVVKSVAPYFAKSQTDRTNVLQEPSTVADALKEIPQPQERLAQLLNAASHHGSKDILALDPTDRLTGYSELEAWVDGSLDMYKVNLNIDDHYPLDSELNAISQSSDLFSSPFSVTSTWILSNSV